MNALKYTNTLLHMSARMFTIPVTGGYHRVFAGRQEGIV